MAARDITIRIGVSVNLPFWDAVKLRIAGGRATETVVREILARIIEPQPAPPEAPHA